MRNRLAKDACFDGAMFETYGKEREFVLKQPESRIWTLVDDGNGRDLILNGVHFVNRLGYFITEVPCPDDVEIEVLC